MHDGLVLTSPLVGYKHRDISAGLRQVYIYNCWFSHTTTTVLVSKLQRIQTYLLIDATLPDMHAGRV